MIRIPELWLLGTINAENVCAHIGQQHAGKWPWPDTKQLNNP
jgi:hypothetical protein